MSSGIATSPLVIGGAGASFPDDRLHGNLDLTAFVQNNER